jgi:hypothetical protein
MRFKEWLESIGGAATSIMHGGLQDLPGSRLNINLPVRSKISTKDGCDKAEPDAADGKMKPDAVFGFRSPEDRNASAERAARWIDKNRKRVHTTRIPPDTIY